MGRQPGQLRRQVHRQGVARIHPATQLVNRCNQLTELQGQAPARAQRRAEGGAELCQRAGYACFIQLAADQLPLLQATQQRQVAEAMQQPRAVAALLVEFEHLGQAAAVFGGVQCQLPIAFGESSQ
ncbi:hypothetical protein D9M73_244000 [compost metagenome]